MATAAWLASSVRISWSPLSNVYFGRGFSAAVDWFSVFFFSAAALFFWLYYLSMHTGWPERPLASGMQGFGGHMIVRWSAPMSAAELNVRGYVAPVGPVLAEAPWDSLLVVEARCDADGALVLRVEPMAGEVVNAALQFTSLTSGATYQLEADGQSQRFVAGSDGTGAVHVSIEAPMRMRVVEVAS